MHGSILWTYILSSYLAHIIIYMLSCLVRIEKGSCFNKAKKWQTSNVTKALHNVFPEWCPKRRDKIVRLEHHSYHYE